MTFGSRVVGAAADHVERNPEPPVRAEAYARRGRDGVEQRVQVGIRGIGYPTMCPMVLHKRFDNWPACMALIIGLGASPLIVSPTWWLTVPLIAFPIPER